MQDDIYEGMFIPKGSMVIPNVRYGLNLLHWGLCFTILHSYMLTNENTYRDPHAFIPERFLPKPDGYGEPLPAAAFGFGRRSVDQRYIL